MGQMIETEEAVQMEHEQAVFYHGFGARPRKQDLGGANAEDLSSVPDTAKRSPEQRWEGG